MEIVSSIEDSREIATWGETILGVLPVLTFSLVLYLVGKEVSIPIPVTGLSQKKAVRSSMAREAPSVTRMEATRSWWGGLSLTGFTNKV